MLEVELTEGTEAPLFSTIRVFFGLFCCAYKLLNLNFKMQHLCVCVCFRGPPDSENLPHSAVQDRGALHHRQLQLGR